MRHYDPDDPGAAETWGDEERQRRIDESFDPPVGVGPRDAHDTYTMPPVFGYGTENHPGRKVDRDSIARRTPNTQQQ